MKIGIFDSGLGGLIITKALIKKLPGYDYVYLGDTKRVPYGNRSQKTIYQFTKSAVEFLFSQDCKLVVLACNTASSLALRKMQQEFLPAKYPDRKILGVIVPTVEVAVGNGVNKKIGVLATTSTVESKVYTKEFKKLKPSIKVFEQGGPLLVPLIENNAMETGLDILKSYVQPLAKKNIDAIILGCTHYPYLKKEIQALVGKKVKVYSQDEIIPKKLKTYLNNHKEIEALLSKNSRNIFFVTDEVANFKKVSKRLFGKDLNLKKVDYKISL